MTAKTRANYDQAKSLRDGGLSFSQIAEQLEVSRQYVHTLLKSGKEGSRSSTKPTRTATDSSTKLTPRQRKFANGLAEGKTQRQAALDAAPPDQLTERSADSWANRTLKNARFQKSLKEILEENGLADEDIARVHRANLSATRVAGTATEGGKISDYLEVPDDSTRQRSVESAWRLLGRARTVSRHGRLRSSS